MRAATHSFSLPAWRSCMLVWRNAVHWTGSARSMRWGYLMAGLSVLAALIGELVAPESTAGLAFGVQIPLAILGIMHWMVFIPGMLRQNLPGTRLVPGQHRTLVGTIVLVWLATLVSVIVMAGAFSNPAMLAMSGALMITALALVHSGRSWAIGVYLVIVFGTMFISDQPRLAAALSTPVGIVCGVMLNVLFAWSTLKLTFPSGGERHWRILPTQAIIMTQHDPGQLQRLNRNRGRGRAIHAWLLRRDLRPANRAHLMLHALGPNNHRLDCLVPLLLTVACALLAGLAVHLLGLPLEPDMLWMMVLVLTFMLASMQGFLSQRFALSIGNTPGEQALVRLSPRAPACAELNRVLGRQLLRICLGEWALSLAGGAALIVLFGGSATQLMLLASLMCVALAMSGWALADHAGKKRSSFASIALQALLIGVGGVAVLLVLWRGSTWQWALLLLLQVVAALAIVTNRWTNMMNAPVAFPSGRF